jgi:ubiquinone/menaquinone biosynthesis C-methylase UbiE
MSDVEGFVRFCGSDFGSAVMDREAAYVKDHVGSTGTILDVGCGIGSLEERFTSYDIVGVYRSAAMVRTARERVPVPFIQGDARSLPIPTGVIDTVVFVATLEFIPDVDAALAEATRVLEPDSRVIALVLNTQSTYVQSNLQREGSYFQRMAHQDTDALVERIREYVDGKQEYFLEISDETVVESSAPGTAAVRAVVGTPQ